LRVPFHDSRFAFRDLMALAKIVSGGQTGVDRGALDAALEAGFPCGGWCPPGRQAEDGAVPARYPLTELEHGGYSERTLKNVLETDATVILFCAEIEGGTARTRDCCVAHGKPLLVIDAAQSGSLEAAEAIRAFIERENVAVLNVAGPRASKWPEARDYAYAALSCLLKAGRR